METARSQEQSERIGKRRSRGRRGRGGEQDRQQDRSASDDSESTDAGRSDDQATGSAQPSVPVGASAEPGTTTAPEPAAAPATRRRVSSTAPVTPADTTVAILDIPVAVTKREPRKVDDAAAESLLDSVLQSLPEPKQPGQGRAKSRRVSSGSISAPATASEQDGDGPVILGG